jgi:catechol 2,3-dioxygenase-like lactoylglutathione lyase family enzyme
MGSGIMDMRIGYVIVGVRSLDDAIAFYRDVLGFELLFSEEQFHFASFKVGDMQFSLAAGDGAESAHGAGNRNTGIGFTVADVDAAHAELVAKGVHFTMAPSKQPWGGYMAMFADPDGNEYYLDQTH